MVSLSMNATEQWFSNFSEHQNHLEGWWNHRWLGATLRVSDSDSVGLGWNPRMCISRFLGNAAAMVSLGTPLWQALQQTTSSLCLPSQLCVIPGTTPQASECLPSLSFSFLESWCSLGGYASLLSFPWNLPEQPPWIWSLQLTTYIW